MPTLKQFLANRRRVRALLEVNRARYIVTPEGQAMHIVRRVWNDEDQATTACGLRIHQARGRMAEAATLTRTPRCRSCDPTIPVWQEPLPDEPPAGVYSLGGKRTVDPSATSASGEGAGVGYGGRHD
jgi:hypothetical protein